MRFRHADGSTVHLAYCTNVHAGDTVEDVLAHLDRFCLPVRSHLGSDLLGVGLWLAAPAARVLAADPARTAGLRAALAERGLETVTLNAFPYRGFQEPVVKHRVYHPDWTGDERLDYTLDCARVLAGLLPDDAARGSVSTLPLAWRTPWDDGRAHDARERLDRLAAGLADLEEETGRTVRVGLEPEPGCVVETVADAADHLAGLDGDRLGVCLDVCHLATGFEDVASTPGRLAAAGLPVVKSQVSAALHAADPHDPTTREALAAFDEERFLHQTRRGARPGESGGAAGGVDDLPEALAGGLEDAGDPWRVHFHVPLGEQPQAPLTATQDTTRDWLATLVAGPVPLTDHLEVETYTWGVLPERLRPRTDDDLARRIAGELAWTRDRLVDLGLKEIP
ncbi:metabolite traffic protein EboE [Phycicoccus sp. BSK3Z-2]|uniref:Metabolite traffic protein EboE n=1 Tax=Phycicoccus avicenniae TaxID=2828860 RepID=A0A941D5J1_9MICO|nr:metabolite traffic protein EboE [Phycicoccus avicenniae]MBR7742021.1 metabolite traffic protein EboE [Phycicoccus avicenniae]